MDSKWTDGIASLVYPLMLKKASGIHEVVPFIPIFAYQTPADVGDDIGQLKLFEHTYFDDLVLTREEDILEDVGDFYDISSVTTSEGNSTLSVPQHVFVQGDVLYVYRDRELIETVSVVRIDAQDIIVDREIEDNGRLCVGLQLNTQDTEENSITFVGISANISIRQYRLYDNVITVPIVLGGDVCVRMSASNLKQFSTGDNVYLKLSGAISSKKVTFNNTGGVYIGVCILIEDELCRICLKYSMIKC